MLANYLHNIRTITPQDKEHTHRAALQYFLESILKASIANGGVNQSSLKSLRIIHEPKNDKEGRGAPDFLILNNGLSIGYIENKRVNADLDSLTQSPQIHKYLSLSDNIMLTDYLRFCLVCPNPSNKGEITKEVRICELSQLSSILKNKALLESKEKDLLELFTLFFTHSPKPINTALEFANTLSLRTRLLKDELSQNKDNIEIQGLFNTFKEALYKELEFESFCDSFAQTLTYSLFLSRLNNTEDKPIDLFNAKKFIPKSFPLIKAMSGFLNNLQDLDSIEWLLDEILQIINHINIADLTKELNTIAEKNLLGHYTHKDPYLHFYETFLSSYDPRLRELRGVYYTPASVVSFIIEAIDSILKSEFSQKQGLASALHNEHITLLDFATGTGTFLLEAFRKALQDIPTNSPKYNPKALIERFYGFEFLIAPYTIAHLKISQSFKEEFNSPLSENESLNITLTNTLYFQSQKDEINKQSNIFAGMIELAEEFKKAQTIKENKILIITGNPPYNANSINKYDIENYKFCGLDSNNKLKPINEKKHRLNDDYIKFIRFAQNKADKQDSAILAFITNNSFLDAVTMNGMRWSLLNSFDKVYFLNLHGDSNKQEIDPNTGLPDSNVFDIQQGVAISIFIKTKAKQGLSNTPNCKVFYADLYGKRQDKYNFLYENTLNSIIWQELFPQAPFYEFYPQDMREKNIYNTFKGLKEIFSKTGLGICTYRDSFCYADSKEELKNRLEIFSTQEIEENRTYFNLPKDSGDWTIKNAKEELLNKKLDFTLIQKVHYKPYDFKYTFYTGKSKGFLGRPAGAIQDLMLKNNIGLVCYRSCNDKVLDNIFIANTLIDLHLVGSGSNIFPLYRNKDIFDADMNCDKLENFTQDFREFMDSKYSEHFSPEAILGYIYAVLFHKDYREKYIDFLKIDFPKIPFVESKEKLIALSKLGQNLIATHLMQDNLSDTESIGEALFLDTANKSLAIEKPNYKESEQRLFVNKSLYFDKVSKEVWEYKIGGYAVLDKYLKSHKGEEIDYAHFQKIIQALTKSLEIESRIAIIALK